MLSREDSRKNIRVCVTIAVIVILLLRVVFVIHWVDTDSMEPSINAGSVVFCVRLPYIAGDPEPSRGDVVSFISEELHALLIKRVIGVPGDRVSIHDGSITINGEPLDEPYLFDPEYSYPEQATFDVPEGCVFVMGDNREVSYDSRAFSDPYIPVADIYAKELFSIALP